MRNLYSNSKTRRAILGSIAFLMGLAILDQGIRKIGDRLLGSPYWPDKLYNRALSLEKGTVALVGDCRPLVINHRLISEELQRPVVNFGKSGSSLGHVLFTLKLLESRREKLSKVFLFLTSDILRTTAPAAREEMAQLFLFWPLMGETEQAEIRHLTSVTPGLGERYSGLWRYRGLGPSFIRSSVRAARNTPVKTDEQFDNIYFGTGSLAANLGDYQPPTESHWEADKESFPWLQATIKQTVDSGISIVLVVPPVHRLSFSSAAIQKIVATANRLSEDHKLPLINYLDPNNTWATTDDWWGNPSHLNNKGVSAFSLAMAQDIKLVMP